MHLITSMIKDAWQAGDIVTTLFLDIQGAFPNMVKEHLLHNMRDCKIPGNYLAFIESMLTHRRTWLKFNDFILGPISINNGTTQGCPLSMILYAFYNTPLIEVATLKHELSPGFMDDCAFLVRARNFNIMHQYIKDMMEHPQGRFEWSILHNSPFELTKLALMNHPRSHHDVPPPNLVLTRTNPNSSQMHQTVKTVKKYKYLSAIFDRHLW